MQLYHRSLFVFIFLQCILFNAHSQESPITELVIFGTKHRPNTVYNGDSLIKAVLNLKPDVILIESDSTSYYFKTGVFRPLPGWSLYLRRIGVRPKLDPEDDMLHSFYCESPQVIIKPHDVAFNGVERRKYRKKLLQLEEDFEVAMSAAYERNEMSVYRANVHLARRQLISYLLQRINGPLQDFNTDSTTKVVRQLETLDRLHFKALVDSVPSLQRFAIDVYKQQELNEHRNEVMVQQILRYASEYSGKRIVVIVGLLHRYFQLDKLASKREQYHFRLLDINGDEIFFPL
jgi:hypothetical protein